MKYEAPELNMILLTAKEAFALIEEEQEGITPNVSVDTNDIDIPL